MVIKKALVNMLGLTLLSCSGHAEEPQKEPKTMTNYYTRQTHINDVMNDTAFGDYGRLIFPVNTGYWSGTTLEQLQLTWYNYIDPDKTVEVCNYLRAHAADCFIDIYTEAEKQANPELRNTGLFFFRAAADSDLQSESYESGISNPLQPRPFAICNAGGGFSYVGSSIVPAMPTRTWPVPSPTSATTPTSWVSAAQATRSGVAPLAHGWQRHWAIVPIYAH